MTNAHAGRTIPALDIGGTHVTGALVSGSTWRVVPGSGRRQLLYAQGTAQEILGSVLGCANEVGAPPMQRWGVALPGPFDYSRGIGLYEGVAKFDALHGVDVGRALINGLQPPASGVSFINDADAFLLGEWVAGAAAGHRRVVGITLGTGVGSAFLADGVVVADDRCVPPEGRVDLLTIHGRPLEETVSRRAILARYSQLTGLRAEAHVDVQEIAEQARGGEIVARRVLDEAMVALGETLVPWLECFGARVVVVGGSMAGSWDVLAGPLSTGMTEAAGVEVVCAAMPNDAALIGAAWHAAQQSVSG